MRYAIVAAVVLASGAGGWLVVQSRSNRLVWDHFDVVKDGILYRSGQLRGEQLERAIQAYGLRTIVNFQVPGEGVDYERAICRKYGIDFIDLPMPGDGFGREDQFREVLAACDDPHRRPVLVHCARGTCRTGAAVALYRYERDGWAIEDVDAEMRRQSYRDGYLPGYVYQMAKNKPTRDLFDPAIVRDSNLPQPPPPPAPREVVPDLEGLPAAEVSSLPGLSGPKVEEPKHVR